MQAFVKFLKIHWHNRRLRATSIAILLSVSVCLALFAVNRFAQWRHQKALSADIQSLLAQTTDQLNRALVSRRGTLTFIRDILNRQPDHSPAQLKAIGASATQHTRHLLGTGLIRENQSPKWWYGPRTLDKTERNELIKAIEKRSKLSGVWKVPSTLAVWAKPNRPLLIMMEPLEQAKLKNSAVVGVFDLDPLLRDFFSSGLAQRHPARIMASDKLLYSSEQWQATTFSDGENPAYSSETLHMDAIKWTLQMQPGKTEVLRTLSWVTIVIVSLSVISGIGLLAVLWMLVTRTWLLQAAIRRRTAALRRTTTRLRQLATTDELTGIYNRRHFMNRWIIECQRSERYHRPLACLMIDVNKFKQVNDTLGHAFGDAILIKIANALRIVLRQTDILARYGGDEFIVGLPETPFEHAEHVANKIRAIAIPVDSNLSFNAISLSVGIASNLTIASDPDLLIKAADDALYADKKLRSAKNQLVKH